jgi:hypothetical protein
MIRLFTSYYKDEESRMKELDSCLRRNIENSFIDEVVLLSEIPAPNHNKINEIIRQGRPTFNTFFNAINLISSEGDISIIANADIYFDETIAGLSELKSDECFALTRWDMKENLDIKHYEDGFGSQDAWIFKGPIRKIDADFMPGILGCDNRLGYEIARAGYKLRNPSKTIRSIHYHLSNVRHYDTNKIPSPYLMIYPEEL